MKNLSKIFLLACVLLFMGIQSASAVDPRYKDVDLSTLRFGSQKDAARYNAMRACFQRYGKEGFSYASPHLVGNFIEEAWVKGKGADPYNINTPFMNAKGSIWYELSTLHYKLPDVFGVEIKAGNNAANDQWGISFYYADNGKSILGSGFGVIFSKFGNGSVTQNVTLDDWYLYKAGATDVKLIPPGGQDAELAKYIASPESLKMTFVERQKALLAEVEKTIKSHKAKKIVHGPYLGGGIPPEETYVPMTAKDEEEELAKARKEIGAKISAIEGNYKLFYNMLMDLIDLKACFK